MNMSHWKQQVQGCARRFGFDIFYFDRIRLMNFHGIKTVLDVGANVGQFGAETRSYGFKGDLISFEPLSRAFADLKHRASTDARWRVFNYALGDRDGTAEINVSANSMSSSLLAMRSEHVKAAPEAGYVGSEQIRLHRLDTVICDIADPDHAGPLLLKLDTQGSEYAVLQGAQETLPRIAGLQVEMSLSPLYEGEKLFEEMVPYICSLGFSLVSI